MRLIILTTILLLIVTTSVQAENYKNNYCKRQKYYTNSGDNDGGTYPHLHCDRRWITYSKSHSKHYNFADGNGVIKSKANNACSAAKSQSATKLKDIIKEICDDYEENCSSCN